MLWAFDGVRKDVQKQLGKEYRIYFKHARKLLFKRFDELDDEQKQRVNIMLYLSPTLCTAHFYKEDFLKILDCKDRESAKSALYEWINCAFDCGIERFKKCAQTILIHKNKRQLFSHRLSFLSFCFIRVYPNY